MGSPPLEQEIAVPLSEAVFASLEQPAADLPPLSDAIDLDALERLVPAEATPEVTVAFSYQGLDVYIHSGRTICVRAGADAGGQGATGNADGRDSDTDERLPG
jgi:hypothetical protein